MNADAKLATREKVSTASAALAVIAMPEARRITHASSAINRYEPIVAVSSTASRSGLPRTRSSICRSTAITNRPTRPSAIALPNERSIHRSSDWT
jgi:hypothetical protein